MFTRVLGIKTEKNSIFLKVEYNQTWNAAQSYERKPWNWFNVAKCSSEGDSAAFGSSSSVVQFGEDPVTQMVDLVVIKDTTPVCTSRTTNQTVCALLNPGLTHSVWHPHSSVTLWNEELQNTTVYTHTHTHIHILPLLLTSPHVYVHAHSTTSFLLRCTFLCHPRRFPAVSFLFCEFTPSMHVGLTYMPLFSEDRLLGSILVFLFIYCFVKSGT